MSYAGVQCVASAMDVFSASAWVAWVAWVAQWEGMRMEGMPANPARVERRLRAAFPRLSRRFIEVRRFACLLRTKSCVVPSLGAVSASFVNTSPPASSQTFIMT